ncbi:MAG: MarR family transcriptional regulator [Deltaproteobacteria bacterium]|nr:MarR family transcriptional regulator [Deltaproteobacteria bacterium]
MWEQPYNTYQILEVLADNDQDRMTVNELSDALDMSIQQTSRAVNNLFRYHWLYRKRIPCNHHAKGWVYGYQINFRGKEYLDYKRGL